MSLSSTASIAKAHISDSSAACRDAADAVAGGPPPNVVTFVTGVRAAAASGDAALALTVIEEAERRLPPAEGGRAVLYNAALALLPLHQGGLEVRRWMRISRGHGMMFMGGICP